MSLEKIAAIAAAAVTIGTGCDDRRLGEGDLSFFYNAGNISPVVEKCIRILADTKGRPLPKGYFLAGKEIASTTPHGFVKEQCGVNVLHGIEYHTEWMDGRYSGRSKYEARVSPIGVSVDILFSDRSVSVDLDVDGKAKYCTLGRREAVDRKVLDECSKIRKLFEKKLKIIIDAARSSH